MEHVTSFPSFGLTVAFFVALGSFPFTLFVRLLTGNILYDNLSRSLHPLYVMCRLAHPLLR